MIAQSPIVLDASAAIVLFATGRIQEIVSASPAPFFVVRETISEVSYLRGSAKSTDPDARERVDWQPLLDQHLIGVLERRHPFEFAEFVRLAQLIDEGEAAAAASARHHGYALAIDDMKARRVVGSALSLVWSLDLLHHWCVTARIPADEISTILTNIRRKATYHPHRSHPRLAWWQQHFVPE